MKNKTKYCVVLAVTNITIMRSTKICFINTNFGMCLCRVIGY